MSARPSGRRSDEIRSLDFIRNYTKYAEGSCLVKCGDTHVLCTATVEDKVPPFLKGKGTGWITAEYGMLPRATHTRMEREASKGKQSGRTQEIQRLISRSLRCVVDLTKLGERQIKIDCDVIQADGGTRTASINGGYVALVDALQKLIKEGVLPPDVIINQVAAISAGILDGKPVVDLDYDEDSTAHADANFVMTSHGYVIEIQGTAEKDPFEKKLFTDLMTLAENAICQIADLQRKALAE